MKISLPVFFVLATKMEKKQKDIVILYHFLKSIKLIMRNSSGLPGFRKSRILFLKGGEGSTPTPRIHFQINGFWPGLYIKKKKISPQKGEGRASTCASKSTTGSKGADQREQTGNERSRKELKQHKLARASRKEQKGAEGGRRE